MSMRSSRSMLDMPHWTRASPATARTAAIIGTHSETECRCRIDAPAATHRSASAATSAMASGYANSGLSQLLFGVAVITSGGISGAIYRPLLYSAGSAAVALFPAGRRALANGLGRCSFRQLGTGRRPGYLISSFQQPEVQAVAKRRS